MKYFILGSCLTILSATAFASLAERESQQYEKDISKLHLLLATKLVIARDKGYVCETSAYPNEIISELGKFSYQSKEIAKAVKQVPAFNKRLGDNLAYKKLLSGQMYGEIAPEKLSILLEGTVFYSMGRGAMGSTTQLHFEKNGVLKIRRLDIDTMKWNETASTFKVLESIEKDSDKINRVQADLGGDQGVVIFEMPYTKDAQDKLVPTGATDDEKSFFSQSDECDA